MHGKVLINIDKSSCKNIASLMMGGMEVEYNEITKSAVGELCNMILGTSATVFSNSGVKINISSPTIIDGTGVTVSDKEQILCMLVSIIDKTSFHVNISTKKMHDIFFILFVFCESYALRRLVVPLNLGDVSTSGALNYF